jgi:hypothetical protein
MVGRDTSSNCNRHEVSHYPVTAWRPTVRYVNDPDSLDELIADCADIPDALCTCHLPVPPPRAATPWEVDETCLAQVIGLDEFV